MNVISDIVIVFSTILLINNFGISKIEKPIKVVIGLLYSLIISAIMMFSHEHNFSVISIFLYPLMFLIPFYYVYRKINIAQIYLALVVEFSVTLLSSCLTNFIVLLSSMEYTNADTLSTFIIRIIVLMAAIFITSNKKFLKIKTISEKVPLHIFVLVLLSLICVTFLSASNNLPVNNTIKQVFVSILIALLSIFVIIIFISLLMNVVAKSYYTALNTLLEKQVSAQIAHYEKLEKLSSDMRTFRHDYINHLSSISALITEGFYDDAQRYIDRLTESTHRNETIFRTGNRLADAILTDKSENCKAFADIVFDGCITDKIGNSDICIILANALDNAAEACKSCPERGRISIESQVRQGYWKMVMRNPTVGADSEGIMKTSKEDERNHGFGLLSIEQVVKRYDGTMSVSIKNGVFELAVVLKLPMEQPQ